MAKLEEIILITLSLFILIVLIEELFKDFNKIRVVMYGIFLVTFLNIIKNYFTEPTSLYFNYIALIIVIAVPLLICYYIIYDLLSKREENIDL